MLIGGSGAAMLRVTLKTFVALSAAAEVQRTYAMNKMRDTTDTMMIANRIAWWIGRTLRNIEQKAQVLN